MSECTSCKVGHHRNDLMTLSSLATLDTKMTNLVTSVDYSPPEVKRAVIALSALVKDKLHSTALKIAQNEKQTPGLVDVPRREALRSIIQSAARQPRPE